MKLLCAGCGTVAEGTYPFRCKRAGRGPVDHVVTRAFDSFSVEFARGDNPNPFIRHRELFTAWHAAKRRGLTDDRYVDLVRRLDDAVAEVDGRGFRTTPFTHSGDLWIKDETGTVAGSHKARHLMGILLYLEVMERRDKPPLAIASCGNAALAAATLARAVKRRLQVFVPPGADVRALVTLGAEVTACPREPGVKGDPTMTAFRAAVAAGALPFCCQGSENGMTIEGGETLGYEMAGEYDHLVVQVGGGALASSLVQAFNLAARTGLVKQFPKLHTVQTEGAHPLRRAVDGVRERMRTEGFLDAMAWAAKHRPEFMWPWETEPHSVAEGILDDETYDWLVLVRAMIESGGSAVVVDEDTLREANRLARETTGINVSHTGSAGLAGVLKLRREGTIKHGESVAVIFSGVQR